METFGIYEDEDVCANCARFVQHYAQTRSGMLPINAGHCMEPRIKRRKPGDTCPNFERRKRWRSC